MNHEIKKIPFENGELLGVRTEDGKVWLGVKKACLDIGLSEGQARRQVENIQEDLVLNEGVANLRFLSSGGATSDRLYNRGLRNFMVSKDSIDGVFAATSATNGQEISCLSVESAKSAACRLYGDGRKEESVLQ